MVLSKLFCFVLNQISVNAKIDKMELFQVDKTMESDLHQFCVGFFLFFSYKEKKGIKKCLCWLNGLYLSYIITYTALMLSTINLIPDMQH